MSEELTIPIQSEFPTIIQALQKEFVRRCRKNPSYSLRAYAKFLDIDQSLLSKILRGSRRVSNAMAQNMGPKLGLTPSQISENHQDNRFMVLEDDEFTLIAEWSHFAILELTKTQKTPITTLVISKRLGIHIEEARIALERLKRTGLIRSDSKGKLFLNSKNNSWTNNKYTTEARRLLQKSLLEKSIEAVELIPFEKRDNGSLTVAIDKNRLPEFKERLKEIRQELGTYFQTASTDLNEVYQLTMSFFPLTKEEVIDEPTPN